MFFGFLSIQHGLSFVRKMADEMEKFATKIEARANAKLGEAEQLRQEAAAHMRDGTDARAIAAAMKNALGQ